MRIERFTLNDKQNTLTLVFHDGNDSELTFEYLRVYSPAISAKKESSTLVTHKKSVKLSDIESVGKHGFRFLFNDQHSAIYSCEYLIKLCQEQEQRWQDYLDQLKTSGHTREALIDITQL
ncbi:MAG: gamma-butyrobetaine hydroxylase-like domain-containing protein [Colwellia sp.]|nr:gamma-butyrobetaine hydroxylase-like domain-containing protein [Colwellia sp.]MCW9081669.1 gamma-butyrobetaine hydroxylase-like domain-containing protein [Colwellia sp.]